MQDRDSRAWCNMTCIWWLRRDLRLQDNLTLQAALHRGGTLVPVFILDPRLLSVTPARRQAFLFEGLRALDTDLRESGSRLIVRRGQPERVLADLLRETQAEAIFAEEDYTPYARQRDGGVARKLPLTLIHGQTVHHPLEVLKADHKPYNVFTPYSKTWKALLTDDVHLVPTPGHLPAVPVVPSDPLPSSTSIPGFPAGETEARRRLENFINTPRPTFEGNGTTTRIYAYAANRDRLDLDGTSTLSPYIRFGMLGLRQAAHAALLAINRDISQESRQGAKAWLNELVWREFYIQILFHYPHVSHRAFNPTLADIPWCNSETEFRAWQEGHTGVPVVDAAMRQLRQTGWMHNRARMIAASFLVKDLLIDWRWGERWFMQHLLDGDQAANNGGWQWVAGTGTDAAPYFRVFNPVLQGRKFDPHGDYIRQWLPEMARVPNEAIHAPWEKGLQIPGYPSQPIVDHRLARQRSLQAYKQAQEAARS